jgi:hypothetical protein
MRAITLRDLQASVQDKAAFGQLADYAALGQSFLSLLKRQRPTRIVSPSHRHYIFFQYDHHDVQRAVRGDSIFGVNATFKSNHFLGYSVALNRLDGVYYVDPLPEMKSDARFREQIFDFQQFLVHDLWTLSNL